MAPATGFYAFSPTNIRLRSLALLSLFLLSLIILSSSLEYNNISLPHVLSSWRTPAERVDTHKRVEVRLDVMSQCPDARDCEEVFAGVVEKGAYMIDFHIDYIAALTPTNDITCKHGPTECLGNIQQLCLAQSYPNPHLSLPFILCQNLNQSQIPQNGAACLVFLGLDLKKWEQCVEGDEGRGLLITSARGVQERNVTRSCTVEVGGRKVCVRDGGEWMECEVEPSMEGFLELIASEYEELNADGDVVKRGRRARWGMGRSLRGTFRQN
ncbi:hypothetical protein SAICODRAFT_20148 [Saitoella complicata NRRL Y-17804]|uniref:Gamma interferon inducible lysosomal thiol reductase GILT n=1 Tax=Saitoella complicata (strain BCRC 22490 / CBS 7301 / JCM 7358 / NBRC 10748 / NRRL Y-17804) TaxID=698492 RepID=A0A0E9NSP3_SAICN|nr:uncharacterized protein SAICODRAFT_20148 [Saitoella complicata NRRL Y-17804]ODQ52201.1 hypothetical protein SAICODRAFT_20148 [Saitoella complicata NRRL Y-17804]GAO52783.1 hypothetical protein G7K_6850-t1 [Saitoella complicata NRRL Y-17804]